MKKLLSVLLATAILLCMGLLPAAAAENIEDKDDSRLDIGEIFGYYQKVTFIDGDTESSEYFKRGTEITYPALTPVRGYDYVWSLSESEYSPAPSLIQEEDITVYSFKNPVVGFENYPEDYIDSSGTVNVSTDYSYNDGGSKSLKYSNIQSETAARNSSIALGTAVTGTSYKISFKYYVPTAVSTGYCIVPFTGAYAVDDEGNETDGMRVDYTDSEFTVSNSTETGVWLDGDVYFTADEKATGSYNCIYLWINASEYNNGDSIYFDHITIEEMVTADFVISDNVNLTGTNGVLKDNVFTAYYSYGSAVTAPDVTSLDGTPVVWTDAQGNTVTEFVAGGVYSLKLDSKGDLNEDGAVSTLDLAIMKLYLVEAVDASEFNVDNADINLNGKVEIVDMAYLKLYLAGVLKIL